MPAGSRLSIYSYILDDLKEQGSQESDPGCLVRCSTEKLDWLMNISYNKANGY